jgi:hypothetical protein
MLSLLSALRNGQGGLSVQQLWLCLLDVGRSHGDES